MALFNSAISFKPFFSKKNNSLSFTKITTENQYPFKFKIKPNSISPFSNNLPIYRSKKIRFFARTSRKNYLREKLLKYRPKKVNFDPPVTDNDVSYSNIEKNYSNIEKNSVEGNISSFKHLNIEKETNFSNIGKDSRKNNLKGFKYSNSGNKDSLEGNYNGFNYSNIEKNSIEENINGSSYLNVEKETNFLNIEKDSVEQNIYLNFEKSSAEENIINGYSDNVSEDIDDSVKVLKTEFLGESDLRKKLERWADEYKADLEFWGIGLNPVFTVLQNNEGKIEKVVVNEDEILERNGVQMDEYKKSRFDSGFVEVNKKIARAKYLAREMERGKYEVPKSSSLAKVVVIEKASSKRGFFNSIKGFSIRSNLPLQKISKLGIVVLCGFFVIWVIRALFAGGEEKKEYTRLEKEMLRRKLKSRMEKENLVKGSVEVINDPLETKMATVERPKLDKEELLSSITKAKPFGDGLVVEVPSSYQGEKPNEFEAKVMEIREMAKRAREIEKEDSSSGKNDERGQNNSGDFADELEVVEEGVEKAVDPINGLSASHLAHKRDISEILLPFFSKDLNANYAISDEEALVDTNDAQTSDTSKTEAFDCGEYVARDPIDAKESDKPDPTEDIDTQSNADISSTVEAKYSNTLNGEAVKAKRGFGQKPRVITSVKEAKRFLSKKGEKPENVEKHQGQIMHGDGLDKSIQDEKESEINTKQSFEKGNGVIGKTIFGELSQKSEKLEPVEEHRGQSLHDNGLNSNIQDNKETDINTEQSLEKENGVVGKTISGDRNLRLKNGKGVVDKTILGESNISSEKIPSAKNKNWMEDNFHTLDPVIKKIGGGFRENYVVAREKLEQELDITSPMNLPDFDDDGELDWMKNDRLREIVFKVRDNELSGRDPFYLMDEEDRLAFYKGLEEKVEKENGKLCKLHEYLHSNIENLDYGADGMSVYDPPEKIIPRWKGPPINKKQEQNPEFLENFVAQRKTLVNGSSSSSDIKSKDGINSHDKLRKSPSNEKIIPKSDLTDQNKKGPKTIIEGSDGSFRAGKKSGKEFWEHTKKWSQGFLDSYNAEIDPEIKAVMRDMGKDLDRWITPKEIKEADDLMNVNELPEKKKEFIEKKLSKVKREMELFGPAAVLTKYKEYGDQKEEDYLWWLDLPFVLCIELYTNEDGEERIGLYSLQMAKDLELDPKPIHVIAFEDPGDCKNLCYIIQAHMGMQGSGNAFVVARPPKDAFQEAKANGFSVTVIRKGELKLNIDQPLEEVEEEITEIGTKIYHDQIMGKQSVDMSALMNGVFGVGKPSKRLRTKRKLKRLAKLKKKFE